MSGGISSVYIAFALIISFQNGNGKESLGIVIRASRGGAVSSFTFDTEYKQSR
ncbi:hypothetical protein EVA_10603 [gut metagenome]|uniref:Uncharacterized protein n=1 Tax=gut metagenome TaxID=749906 RepID=J9CMG4_9ZZZZ